MYKRQDLAGGETQLCDLNAPVIGTYENAAAQIIPDGADGPGRGPASKNWAPARGSGAARDTLEAQLKQRPKFKADVLVVNKVDSRRPSLRTWT